MLKAILFIRGRESRSAIQDGHIDADNRGYRLEASELQDW